MENKNNQIIVNTKDSNKVLLVESTINKFGIKKNEIENKTKEELKNSLPNGLCLIESDNELMIKQLLID